MKRYILPLLVTVGLIVSASSLKANVVFNNGNFVVIQNITTTGSVKLINNANVRLENIIDADSLVVSSGCSFTNNALTHIWTNIISGSIAGNNGVYNGGVFFQPGASINLPINSFVGNPYINWNLFSVTHVFDLSLLSKDTPLTINLTGSSGKGNGGGSYSFDFID
jgi:hypothetical protein